MSRSNSYNYSLTRNQLITKAYIDSGIYRNSETVSSADMDTGNDILNWMIKAWSVEGVHLWKRRQATLFTALATSSYDIGSTGWHCTNSYVSTTSSSNSSAATAIALVSTTGMAADDFIGIKLDDGTRQWTTIASVDSSTQVTVDDALTDDSAEDNTVVAYTSKINRPLRLLRATKYDLVNNSENKLKKISYDMYFDLPVKTSAGDPNNFYYDKQLDDGVLYTYPVTSNVDRIIKFTYLDLIMDMDTATDDFDFPSEWVFPLVRNLAVEFARNKGNTEKVAILEPSALSLKMSLQNHDSDDEDMRIRIKYRYTR